MLSGLSQLEHSRLFLLLLACYTFQITNFDQGYTLRVRLDWTRSDAKQPKFDVIDSSRKLAKGCNRLQPSQAVAQQRLLAGCSEITY